MLKVVYGFKFFEALIVVNTVTRFKNILNVQKFKRLYYVYICSYLYIFSVTWGFSEKTCQKKVCVL